VHAVTARRVLRGRRRPRARDGFTLIEVIAAILLLSIGLLAIAGLGIVAAKTTRRGSTQTLASAIAQSRFDSLASLPCRTLAVSGPTVGSASVRGVEERWRVVDGYNVKRLTDSLTVPGRATALVYQSVIPCRE
jgi:type IV pilus assembly protein PilV